MDTEEGKYYAYEGTTYLCRQDHDALCVGAGHAGPVAVGGRRRDGGVHHPAAAGVVVAIIEAVAARDRRNAKKEREAEAKQRKDQEELVVLLIQGNWAAIALGEPRRGRCSGSRTPTATGHEGRALKYATDVKAQTEGVPGKGRPRRAGVRTWAENESGRACCSGCGKSPPVCQVHHCPLHRLRGRWPAGTPLRILSRTGRTRRGCWGVILAFFGRGTAIAVPG